MLLNRGVKYSVVPVMGNSEIIEHFQQLEDDTEVRMLVLLNCGASLDIQQQLEESEAPAELCCYVIDAHRPLLLANLSARHKRVIVLDDDPLVDDGGIRPPVDDSGDVSGASDSGNSDNEKENIWDPDAEPGAPARKRQRKMDRQARMEMKRQRVNEYYSTSYYAIPVAMSLFKMAKNAATLSQDVLINVLWLAAISLVGYFDQGLMSEVEYNRLAWEELKEALDHTTDFGFSSSLQTTAATVPEPSSALSDEEQVSAPRRPKPPRSAQGRQQLRFENDLRLTLYRHWTLEESMAHTAYFYGALELHRDKGKRTLKEFFATSGIPPSDYKQFYSCMQVRIRKTIHDKFRNHGKPYGLTEKNMFLQQFVRDLGPLGELSPALFLHVLSCTDAAQIILAILSSVPPSLGSARMESLPHTEDGKRDAAAINELERQAMVDNFWRAFEASLCTQLETLRDGIAEAVELAKTVQNVARLIKDTKAMHESKSRHFRWCKIEQPPHLFRHHLAVRRLAVWLLHVLYAYRPKGLEAERLLVIVRDQVRDTYLCVGTTPMRFSEQDEFGNLFRTVLQTDRSLKYRYDFFDKSCIEIAAGDFDRFWELMSNAPV